MNNLKSIDYYSKEMTRQEFNEMTELEELCPGQFGFENLCNKNKEISCTECWDRALNGIKFKELPSIPEETLPLLDKLKELEIQYKQLEEQRKSLKEELLREMEKHHIEKWENDLFSITYIKPLIRSTVDSKSLLKRFPSVYSQVLKETKTKAQIRFKVK